MLITPSPIRPRNELYDCGVFERKPTVIRLLKGFPSRLTQVVEILGETVKVREAIRQHGKVNRCHDSYERTNGKTFFNLFQAAAKLNEQLLELENQARWTGDCNECGHNKHPAGLCRQCNCGESGIINSSPAESGRREAESR